MFVEPEKNVVIGITKCRMVEEIFDMDELVDVALGNNGQNISFKDYTVLLVEQDDSQNIIEMLQKVTEKGCLKRHIRPGFLNPQDIEIMLSSIVPPQEQEIKQGMEWIGILNLAFTQRNNLLKDVKMEDVLQKICNKLEGTEFTKVMRRSIISNLTTLKLHQRCISDGWRKLASPVEYKSILGLFPKYKFINRLQYNDRMSNPVLDSGLYQLDLDVLHILKKIVLVVQMHHL